MNDAAFLTIIKRERKSIILSDGRIHHWNGKQLPDVKSSDILLHLGRISRFNSIVRSWSVLDHSCVLFQFLLPTNSKLAFKALYHDASEVICGDITSGIKRHCPDYKRIERRIERQLFERLRIPLPSPSERRIIKRLDLMLGFIERCIFIRPLQCSSRAARKQRDRELELIKSNETSRALLSLLKKRLKSRGVKNDIK